MKFRRFFARALQSAKPHGLPKFFKSSESGFNFLGGSTRHNYLGAAAAFGLILFGGIAPSFAGQTTSALTIQSISNSNGKVIIRWQGGGNGPYQVICRTNLSQDWSKLGPTTSLLSMTNTINLPSCFFGVTTDLVAPSAPGSLSVSTNRDPSQLVLTWSPSADNNGGVGMKDYYVFRNNVSVGTVSATSTTLIDSNLTADTTYSYSVLAADVVGNQSAKISGSGKTPKGQCAYSIFPTSSSIGAAATGGSVSITSGTGCAWSASSSASWITITSGSSGTGSGSVTWSAAVNTSTSSRSGTLTIAGQIYTLTQSGATPCSYSLSSSGANPGSVASSGTLGVTAGSGCSWTVTSGATWLSYSPGSGSGNGTVTWFVAANTSSAQRIATLTIAGRTFTVTQAGVTACTYSLSSLNVSLGALATVGTVNVTAGAGCVWTASSSASWITITGGLNGNGSGIVTYSALANTSTSARTGYLSIAGQTFTVSQAGLTVDNPPTVNLTSPGNGATISGTATFTATATDDLGISRVEFWCDGSVLLGTATAAPYSISYNTTAAANGTHTFTAKAFDTTAHSTTSLGISSTVNNSSTGTPGDLKWVKMVAAPSGQGKAYATGVASDRAGNAVAVGWFMGTVDFGIGPIASYFGNAVPDAFVVKYSAQGTVTWAKRLGGNDNDLARAVAVDSQSNIVVVGDFGQTIDLGGGSLVSAGRSDIFVVKYSSSGAHLWSKRFGGTGSEFGYTVAVDANDNIILGAGFSSMTCGFGAVTLNCAGSDDIALVKLSGSDGSTLWAKQHGGSDSDSVNAVAVDRAGDIIISGIFWTATDLGGGLIPSTGGQDGFVAKYSGVDGSYRWAKKLGSVNGDIACGVAADPSSGNVVVTGGSTGTLDLGGGAIRTTLGDISTGGIFLAGFDSSGNYLWATATGGSADYGAAVSIDSSGNLAVTGRAQAPIYFGGSLMLVGNGGVNFFVADFSLSGNSAPLYRWSKRTTQVFGGNGGNGIALDPVGHVLTAGFFMGTADFGGTSLSSPSNTDAGFVAQYSK